MLNNYPIKQKNQPGHPESPYQEYTATSDEVVIGTTPNDSSVDIEIEMSRSVYDMRREFRISMRKLRDLYADRELMPSAYMFGYTTPTRIPLADRPAVG